MITHLLCILLLAASQCCWFCPIEIVVFVKDFPPVMEASYSDGQIPTVLEGVLPCWNGEILTSEVNLNASLVAPKDALLAINVDWTQPVWSDQMRDDVAVALGDGRLRRLMVYDLYATWDPKVPGIAPGLVTPMVAWHAEPYDAKSSPNIGPAGTIGKIHSPVQVSNSVLSPDIILGNHGKFLERVYLWGDISRYGLKADGTWGNYHPEFPDQSLPTLGGWEKLETWAKYGADQQMPATVQFCFGSSSSIFYSAMFTFYLAHLPDAILDDPATFGYPSDTPMFTAIFPNPKKVMVNLLRNEIDMMLSTPASSCTASVPSVSTRESLIKAGSKAFFPVVLNIDPNEHFTAAFVRCESNVKQKGPQPDCIFYSRSNLFSQPGRSEWIAYVRATGDSTRLFRLSYIVGQPDATGNIDWQMDDLHPMYICVFNSSVDVKPTKGVPLRTRFCPAPQDVTQWYTLNAEPTACVKQLEDTNATTAATSPASESASNGMVLWCIIALVIMALTTLAATCLAFFAVTRLTSTKETFIGHLGMETIKGEGVPASPAPSWIPTPQAMPSSPAPSRVYHPL